MAEKLIELKNIVKRFGKNEIIKGISLDIMDGEFLTLLGPSGCGKTTILRMLAGFETPTDGEILLNGEDLVRVPANKRQINTVFQSYALFPHMDVRNNIAYGMKMKKITASEINERVDEMLELTKLESLAKRYPQELSGGQQQRVAIARSLVNRPKVLLLDEPLGALDLQLRKSMQLELVRLQKKLGTTYVYVTHDQEEAMTMSDRVVLMHEGKIEQCGTAREIYAEPASIFVSGFLGEANIFEGIYSENDDKAFFAIDNVKFELKKQKGTPGMIAVRPENLKLVKNCSGGLTGTVCECVFMGQIYRIGVLMPSGKIYYSLDKKEYLSGEKVTLFFEPDRACGISC